MSYQKCLSGEQLCENSGILRDGENHGKIRDFPDSTVISGRETSAIQAVQLNREPDASSQANCQHD